VIAALNGACGTRRVVPPSPPSVAQPSLPNPELFVLLPDPEGGDVGRVSVSSGSGTVELSGARESTRLAAGQSPTPVAVLDQAELQRVFGEALSALPLPPRHYTVNFQFASETLTDASRAVFPEILRVVAEWPFPNVIVIGHTDTSGSAATNNELGLRRAQAVGDLLVAAGLAASSVEVVSHGEGDPLVRTPDETSEPRNRRVEIEVQ